MKRFGDVDTEVFDRSFYKQPVQTEVGIFEAADPGDSAIGDLSSQQMRAMAMSTALEWVNGGEFTFEALDILAVGVIDVDGDGEVSEEEEEDYNEFLTVVGDAFVRLGASADDVTAFLDEENEASGKKIGRRLTEKLDNTELSDDDMIIRHATSHDAMILEGTVKVVRNGKVVLKKKRIKKYRMNAAQRAALKKARRKAFTAAARRNRKKAMKIRKQRGL